MADTTEPVHAGGWFVAVHVGAGYHHPENTSTYRSLCAEACRKAKDVLDREGSAVDAVMVAVRLLEDQEETNAGWGSNLNFSGQVECDASLMDGHTAAFGSLAAVPGVKNPIEAASCLMAEEAKGVLDLGLVPPMCLSGEGARQWAEARGLATSKGHSDNYHVSDKSKKQYEEYKQRLESYRQHKRNRTQDAIETQTELNVEGEDTTSPHKRRKVDLQDTVGAICVDSMGRTAASVSSGGLWLKTPGRVGEAAMYGCGCWADSGDPQKPSFACSVSGTGEHISKTLLAHTCALNVDSCDNLHDAVARTFSAGFLESRRLKHLPRKMAGLIAITAEGKDVEFVWAHTTESFAVGHMSSKDTNPKTTVSRLSEEQKAGKTYLAGGTHVRL